MRRRRARAVFGLAAIASFATLAACSSLIGPSGCAGVGYYALLITVSDEFGEGAALGATVTLTDGSYQEHQRGEFDPLNVYAAGDRGGRTYDIQVSKPFYNDVVIRGVKTRGGGCVTGHESEPVTTTVPVRLTLARGAPPIRSVHLVPHHILLDRNSNQSWAFRPYVDANPGVSRVVSWSITGDTASVGFDRASGTLTYRCLPKSGYLWIFARSLVNPALVDSADVAVQGHPALTNDPPCAP